MNLGVDYANNFGRIRVRKRKKMGTKGLNFQRLLFWVINKLFILYFPTPSLSPGKFNEAVQKMIFLSLTDD